MKQDEAKLKAAQRALDFVQDGMSLGLGSGTTSAIFIRELGERVRQGLRVRGCRGAEGVAEASLSLTVTVTSPCCPW